MITDDDSKPNLQLLSKRMQAARLLNGYQTSRDLVAAFGSEKAQMLLAMEKERKRTPTPDQIFMAAKLYRVSTDYIFGLIDCPESKDFEVVKLAMVKSVERSLHDTMMGVVGHLGKAASYYMDQVQPPHYDLLLEHLNRMFELTDSIDLSPPVRDQLTKIRILSVSIQEAQEDQQRRFYEFCRSRKG